MESFSNPWQILDTREIYHNPWIHVIEHQVLNPSGRPGIYGVVHFKNLAIGVVPYQDGHIWLVGQYRFPLERYSWEIPEGGGALDIPAVETARRELSEETGLTAERYMEICRMDLSNSVSDEQAIIFLATGLSEGTAHPEEDEALCIKKVALQEAWEMVQRFEITDSLSVAGIMRTWILSKEGKLDPF